MSAETAYEDESFALPPAPMMKPQAEVLSTGVASTFIIPGLATIPPDDSDHSVQIADLNAPVTFIRTAIPKRSTYVHLKVSTKSL